MWRQEQRMAIHIQPFWTENLDRLYKEAARAEKAYIKIPNNSNHEKREKHIIFKDKQSEFDKAFRKSKVAYRRNKELEIESMVCKSGKELWQKIDELGPKVKCQRIPEQVIIDGNIISDINLVLKEWESKLSELYTGVLPGTSGFDDDFLN